LQTILDEEAKKALKLKRAGRYRVVSTLIVVAVSWLIVALMHPFDTPGANLAVVGGIIMLYLLSLLMFGTRNTEPAILLMLILVLFCLLIPSLKRAKTRSQKAKHAYTIDSHRKLRELWAGKLHYCFNSTSRCGWWSRFHRANAASLVSLKTNPTVGDSAWLSQNNTLSLR
jgi:hypothetical protein